MTEQEAKSKVCCAFPLVPQGFWTSDPVSRNSYRHCVGATCMAWRWIGDPQDRKPTRVHPGVLATHWLGWTVTDNVPDEDGYVEISPPPPPERLGYCGLAGKP